LNRTEIERRLDRLRADCLSACIKVRDATAAEFNAGHRLNSGAYFRTVTDRVLAAEKAALDQMGAFAATVMSAKEAASTLEDHALKLHDELRQMINRTLASEGGSRPAPENAATQVRDDFASKSLANRTAMLENVRHGLTADTTSERGPMNFLKRNAAALIGAAGLIVAILAYLKK
jgi:hypothetical protein